MTCSPTIMVGVERLLYFRTSSKTASWSTLTSFTSKSIPLAERWALATSQGGHPGWLKTTTFFCSIKTLLNCYLDSTAVTRASFCWALHQAWGRVFQADLS